jgi:hypothetical protein
MFSFSMLFFNRSLPLNPVQFQLDNKTICWMLGLTQVLISIGFQQNPQTIGPPGKPEGNVVHRVHNAVSPEIALWGTAILRCLQSRKGLGLYFDPFPHASTLLFIHLNLVFIHS